MAREAREGDVCVRVICCGAQLVVASSRASWTCPSCHGVGTDDGVIVLGPKGAVPDGVAP